MSLIFENSLTAFIVITLVLGGGAAWLTGRAVAMTWGPMWKAIAYMVPLTFAARFLHYALAKGVSMGHFFHWGPETLTWLYYYLVTFVIVSAFSALAFQLTRAWQMEQQYPWLYKRTSPVSWEKV